MTIRMMFQSQTAIAFLNVGRGCILIECKNGVKVFRVEKQEAVVNETHDDDGDRESGGKKGRRTNSLTNMRISATCRQSVCARLTLPADFCGDRR